MKTKLLAVSLLLIASTSLTFSQYSFARDLYTAVERRDTNGDGKVSKDEWDKPPKVFKIIDANGDGYLTPDEFAKKWGIPLNKPGEKAAQRDVAEAGVLDESRMIIADVHMHPHPDNHPVDVLTWMNRNGVKWTGLGEISGGASVREHYSQVMGSRYIPFGGQSDLNLIYRAGGNDALENPENKFFKSMMKHLEEDFEAGKLKGIGEIFANANTTSKGWSGRKIKIDAPTNRQMLDLVGKYGGAITMHMEWDDDSVEQLQALASYNPTATIIMAHCGSNTAASDISEIMNKYDNIYCDLSARHPPKLHDRLMEKKPEQKIFTSYGLEDFWREVIEQYPDRFMVGTDTKSESDYDGGINTIREGLLANLKPETAEKVCLQECSEATQTGMRT